MYNIIPPSMMFFNSLCVFRVQQQVQQFQDSMQWGSGQWVCVHIRRTDLKIQHKVTPELPMQHHTSHHHGRACCPWSYQDFASWLAPSWRAGRTSPCLLFCLNLSHVRTSTTR